MEEQRRVFVAIGLTIAIFIGWQWLIQSQRPAPQAPQEQAAPAAPSSPKSIEAPPPAAAGEEREVVAQESIETFDTPFFAGEITSNGALSSLTLKHYQEQREPKGELLPVSLVTARIKGEQRQAMPVLELDGERVALAFVERGPRRFLMRGTSASGATVMLTARLSDEQYAITYDLQVDNPTASTRALTAYAMLALAPHAGAEKPSLFTPAADMVSGLCEVDESVKRTVAGDAQEGAKVFPGSGWAGLDRQYFVVALVPQNGGPSECQVSAEDTTVLVRYSLGEAELVPGGHWSKSFLVYLGPKRDQELSLVADTLRSVIDYNIWKIPLGFLARPMVAILNVFYGWTASFGLAIILLTFLVKLLLFPVTYKSVVSMRRMSLLKPELDKLKERYGDDRQRMQMEQMKLFREKGVNPLGGCLPMLLQMPVWFALYRTLWTSVDLYQQKFLWLDNLTAKEPFPFLAIAFGLLTVVQQKITPTTIDSQQAKIMMYAMPIVFAFFMIGLPSGLVLYIVVNSVLTIIQQAVINSRQPKSI